MSSQKKILKCFCYTHPITDQMYVGWPMSQEYILQPLFAGPECMVWSDDEYFRTYPSVRSYISVFKGFDAFKDFSNARLFLSQHNRSQGTFGNYRGFIERLLLWSWIYAGKASSVLTSQDFRKFLTFCEKPPPAWLGNAPKARFIDDEGEWIVNESWRPMDSRGLNKINAPHNGSLRQIQSICSSFFSFLHLEGLSTANPIKGFKPQHGRPFSRGQPPRSLVDRDLLKVVLSELKRQASLSSDGERALFAIAAALHLYLRPSDLAINNNRYPLMNVFSFADGKWWFVHFNRAPPQKVPVPSSFLPYLKRYRVSRGLPPLPEADERLPLLEALHGRSGICIRQINGIVKAALIEVHRALSITGLNEPDLQVIKSLSLRWFRDTGAKLDTLKRSPLDLQHGLGSLSPAYVYGRYYAG